MSQVKQPPVIEERHNFDSVNSYIDHLLDRQQDLLSYRRFKRWRTLLVGIAAVLLAAGFAYLLYSWGVYWQKKEPVQEVVLTDLPVPEGTNQQVGEDSNVGAVKVSYTVFQSVDVDRSTKVVTGYNFSPNRTDYPDEQYCYVGVDRVGAKQDTYYVARKDGSKQVDWDTAVPANLFRLGQTHCRFQ